MAGGPLKRIAGFFIMKDPKNLVGFIGLMVAGDCGPYTLYTNRARKVVFYDRAPPLSPPSVKQLHMRGMWRMVSYDWQLQAVSQKSIWELISQRTNIRMTGYNLFLAVETTHRGRSLLPTLLRQAKITSAPPFHVRGPQGAGQYNV